MRVMTALSRNSVLRLGILLLLAAGFGELRAQETSGTNSPALVPLKLNLPAPVFSGTPKDIPAGVNVEPAPATPPPPLMVPKDVRNLAPGTKITSSDHGVSAASLAKITDGNKEVTENGAAILRKGLQWVQFDLGTSNDIYAIAIWHAHDAAKVYRSVIVQVSDDPDFGDSAKTLFNNDSDNSAGLGIGTNRQYFETYQGKVIDAHGARSRYVRLYSHGSTESALNEYTEVEIYGRPAK